MNKGKVNIAPEKRDEIFQKLVDNVRKRHGSGAAFFGDDETVVNVEVIPTGILSLDIAVGVGGFPRGRIVEIFGDESSGKTTLALKAIASAQQQGGKCAVIDVEHALDREWCEKLGVKLNDLIISQPDVGDQALDILEQMILSGVLDIIVVDSVAALLPRAELEGLIGDSHVALQARLVTQALRKLNPAINQSKTMVVFTNQTRDNLNNSSFGFGGSKKTTPGGNALKFYATIRIETKYIGQEKESNERIGSNIRASIKKNKVAPPFRQAEFVILYDEGVSHEGDLLNLAVNNDLIVKAGAWYKDIDGNTIGQGFSNARQFLRENMQYAQDLEMHLREMYGLALPEAVVEDD